MELAVGGDMDDDLNHWCPSFQGITLLGRFFRRLRVEYIDSGRFCRSDRGLLQKRQQHQ